MSLIKEKQIYIFCAVLLGLLISIDVYAGTLTVDGIDILDNYKSSSQAIAGKVQEVTGQVIIIHSDNSKIGYKAAAGFDIYEKDTIISQSDGRTRFEMNDRSTVSLASNTRLVINESVYRAKEKVRSSFLSMLIGKAHFIVKKMSGYNKSRFEIKTKTAVVGVRGSEFIVESQAGTKVTTFEDTILWVENIMFPEQGIKVESFMQTIIGEGMLPTTPEPVSSDAIEQMVQDSLLPAPKKDSLSGKTGQIEADKPEMEIQEIQMDFEDPGMEIDISDIVENIEDMVQDDIPSDVTIEKTPIHRPDQEISGGAGTGGP